MFLRGRQTSKVLLNLLSKYVHVLTMLKIRMNFTERLDDGSGVSSTADVTMRHMCTRMEGKGMQDMTYQKTAGAGAGSSLGRPD
jgi:hypothetical protein